MKKAIILIIILTVSTAYADAQIGKFLSRGLYYGLTHQPTLPPTDYDYEFESVPVDSVSMGVGTAYDTTLSDHNALTDLLTALVVMGALLGLWFLFLSIMPTRKTPKQTSTGGCHCGFKHDVTFPRNREPRFVYLAGKNGVMLI